MNKKNNSQYQETDKAIRDALIKLLSKKELEKISIREICELAGVRHSTFYAHYENIFAVIEDIQNNLWNEHITLFSESEINSDSFGEENGIKLLLEYIYENRKFYKIYFSLPHNGFNQKVLNQLWAYQEEGEMWNVRNKEDYQCAMIFFQAGFTAVVSDWISDNCKEDVASLAKRISACTPKYLKPVN